jgi:hypothetical protein
MLCADAALDPRHQTSIDHLDSVETRASVEDLDVVELIEEDE